MQEEPECDCPPEGAPAWMATFSDMATLMLCFFVLLLSFANMDAQNFRMALGSVKEAFGVQFKVNGDFEGLATTPVELSDVQSSTTLLEEEKPIDADALALVEEFLEHRGLREQVDVSWGERGVIVRLKDRVLFESGRAVVRPEGFTVLEAINDLAMQFDGMLVIEGHTDDVPINSAEYPSNWELSAARSSAVLRFLIRDGINAATAHVAGYAELRPIADNESVEGRAKNRRVEFVFESGERYKSNPRDAFKMPGLKERGPALDVTPVPGGQAAPSTPATQPSGLDPAEATEPAEAQGAVPVDAPPGSP